MVMEPLLRSDSSNRRFLIRLSSFKNGGQLWDLLLLIPFFSSRFLFLLFHFR